MTLAQLAKRGAILAVLASVPVTGASQLRSDADVRRILTDRLKGFEDRVSIVVGVIGPEGRRVVAHGSTALKGRPVDGDTLYEVGSITKVFTSLVLADMVERGEVALDDPVVKFLPAGVKVPERNGKQITLHDLSSHRSGLPRMPSNFVPKDPLNPYVDYPVERLYEFLSSHELRRDIGAEYEYSNLGAGLLGVALAHRAGMGYERLLSERIFRPLGMTSTTISPRPALKPRQSTPHTSVFLLAPTPLWDFTQAFAGAGAVRSSANDMLVFLAACLGYTKSPLSGAIARMLATRRDTTEKFKIGLAWRLEPHEETEIVWHGGATYGSRTFTGFDPKSRAGVVVFSNYNTGNGIDDIGRHLLLTKASFDDGPAVKPRDRTVSTIPPGLLGAYAGRYRFADDEIWTMRRDGTRFFIKKPAEPEFEIFPEGDFEKGSDEFFSKTVDALYTFDFDKETSGVASVLTFRWGFLAPRLGKRIE
jgi:CubicO group peptidase (beta-lactamase class C family)